MTIGAVSTEEPGIRQGAAAAPKQLRAGAVPFYLEGALRTPRTIRGEAPKGPAAGAAPGARPPGYSLQPLRRLLPFITRYRWRFGLMVLFLLVSSISSLIIPSFAGSLIDKGFSGAQHRHGSRPMAGPSSAFRR